MTGSEDQHRLRDLPLFKGKFTSMACKNEIRFDMVVLQICLNDILACQVEERSSPSSA